MSIISRKKCMVLLPLFLICFICLVIDIGVVVAQDEPIKVISESTYVAHESYREIFSGTTYTGDFVHVVGEIQNVNSENREIDDITVTFYDNNGGVVEAGRRYTSLNPVSVLAPGQKSPFEVILLDESAGSLISHYDISVASFKTTKEPATLDIVSQKSYRSSIDYFEVIGEVKNTGTENIKQVEVFITFYNNQGTVIGADKGLTSVYGLEILVPGQKSPFKALNYGRKEITDDIQSYSLSVEGISTSEIPYRALEILTNETDTGAGSSSYEINGFVRNVGEKNATFVKIIATLYDSSGLITGTDYGYTDPSDIGVGETAPFTIFLFGDEAVDIDSCFLQVECSEKSIESMDILTSSPTVSAHISSPTISPDIPEFPSSLMVSLLLSIFVVITIVLKFKNKAKNNSF